MRPPDAQPWRKDAATILYGGERLACFPSSMVGHPNRDLHISYDLLFHNEALPSAVFPVRPTLTSHPTRSRPQLSYPAPMEIWRGGWAQTARRSRATAVLHGRSTGARKMLRRSGCGHDKQPHCTQTCTKRLLSSHHADVYYGELRKYLKHSLVRTPLPATTHVRTCKHVSV